MILYQYVNVKLSWASSDDKDNKYIQFVDLNLNIFRVPRHTIKKMKPFPRPLQYYFYSTNISYLLVGAHIKDIYLFIDIYTYYLIDLSSLEFTEEDMRSVREAVKQEFTGEGNEETQGKDFTH